MRQSEYFMNLSSMYDAEIDDLVSDSEGKNVLALRLKEKRQQLPDLLSMMEYAPEMVAPAFFDAFTFTSPARIEEIMRREPSDRIFPTWAAIAPTVQLADWAKPMVAKVQTVAGGDTFLVVAATLEYLRRQGASGAPSSALLDADTVPRSSRDGYDDDADGSDLADAGNDWLTEQGFDKLES